MDSFITIRIKRETAKRFQKFSKANFKTHSEAMATMLDFFLYNEISPWEKLGPTGRTLENLIKKRNSAVIAIIKNLEKKGINPTLGMMQVLFDGVTKEEDKEPLMVEKKKFDRS